MIRKPVRDFLVHPDQQPEIERVFTAEILDGVRVIVDPDFDLTKHPQGWVIIDKVPEDYALSPGFAVRMGNCGTCKHWVEPTGWFGGDDLSLGYDPKMTAEQRVEQHKESAALNARYRPCTKVDMPDYASSVDPDDIPLAYTMDGSHYRADLMTRAEFGCILHEPEEIPES